MTPVEALEGLKKKIAEHIDETAGDYHELKRRCAKEIIDCLDTGLSWGEIRREIEEAIFNHISKS